MARRLGLAGLVLLAVAVIGALVARLSLPASVLQFGFQIDPAILVLIGGLLLALLLLSLSAALGRVDARRQRALAQQAAELETERRRFIQRLDHELKNPLTAIQVHLDNLQEVRADSEQSAAAVVDVRVQVSRLSLLTRGLRRLADLETRPLEIETVGIGELLDEVIDVLESPERIQLDVQRVPWPIPAIQADRELVLIVLRNLADNALKYSTTPVQVRARHTSGHLIVEVIDTGRGIPPDELPLVTEELYRGSNTRDVAGSGLGLAIVQRIVERHGGHLELRSRVNQGTIATVELPYEQPAAR
jgi:two-component system OmpR family sensor kinase